MVGAGGLVKTLTLIVSNCLLLAFFSLSSREKIYIKRAGPFGLSETVRIIYFGSV